MNRPRGRYAGGFTLVELLLAVIIGALVAAIALGTLHTVSRARDRQQRRSELLSHARYALREIGRDLANSYRGGALDRPGLTMTVRDTAGGAADTMTLTTVRAVREREAAAGTDLWEVQYRLEGVEAGQPGMLVREAAPVGAGGSTGQRAGHTVAAYVTAVEIAGMEGREWQRPWRGARRPRLVRVRLDLRHTQGQQPVTLSVSRVFATGPGRLEWFDADTEASGS